MKSVKKVLALALASVFAVSMASCSMLSSLLGSLASEEPSSLLSSVSVESVSSTKESSSETESSSEESSSVEEVVQKVKNVILLIGDGMGKEHIRAGEIYKGEKLVMQTMSQSVSVSTRSASDEITDSSAAATAMATGVRTNNKYVGVDPNGNELTTIVDYAASLGKATGIITTEELYGGTPMGFTAHGVDRKDYASLMDTAAKTSNVNLFAGYQMANKYIKPLMNAYVEIQDVTKISDATSKKIFGCYTIQADAPSMTVGQTIAFDSLVTEALEYLSKDEDGFFLMAEGAHIDHGGEDNDMQRMLNELLAFDDGVKAALRWAENRNDTVVIVTADHETGGLTVKDGATKDNLLEKNASGTPQYYQWGTRGHSSADVALYLEGAEVDFAKYSLKSADKIQNIDVYSIIRDLYDYKIVM